MRIGLPVVLCCVALPGAAQDLSVAEWATLPRIVDTLCLDLVEEPNGCETILLLASEQDPDSADLVILPNPVAQGDIAPLAVVREVAYAGGFFGQRPSLAEGPDGGLLIQEEQIAIGRTPWMQSIRVIHRGGAFVVAAQSYSTYDRPLGGGFSCDVDFLERTWAVSADRVNPENSETIYDVSETGDLAPAFPVLAQWRWDRNLPPVCDEALSAWFQAAPQ